MCHFENIIRKSNISLIAAETWYLLTDTDGFEIPSLGIGDSDQGEGTTHVPEVEVLNSSSFKVTA